MKTIAMHILVLLFAIAVIASVLGSSGVTIDDLKALMPSIRETKAVGLVVVIFFLTAFFGSGQRMATK